MREATVKMLSSSVIIFGTLDSGLLHFQPCGIPHVRYMSGYTHSKCTVDMAIQLLFVDNYSNFNF